MSLVCVCRARCAQRSLALSQSSAVPLGPFAAHDAVRCLLRGGGADSNGKRAAVARTGRAGVEYPAEDIAALASARRFLEGAGVVNKPS